MQRVLVAGSQVQHWRIHDAAPVLARHVDYCAAVDAQCRVAPAGERQLVVTGGRWSQQSVVLHRLLLEEEVDGRQRHLGASAGPAREGTGEADVVVHLPLDSSYGRRTAEAR